MKVFVRVHIIFFSKVRITITVMCILLLFSRCYQVGSVVVWNLFLLSSPFHSFWLYLFSSVVVPLTAASQSTASIVAPICVLSCAHCSRRSTDHLGVVLTRPSCLPGATRCSYWSQPVYTCIHSFAHRHPWPVKSSHDARYERSQCSLFSWLNQVMHEDPPSVGFARQTRDVSSFNECLRLIANVQREGTGTLRLLSSFIRSRIFMYIVRRLLSWRFYESSSEWQRSRAALVACLNSSGLWAVRQN